MDAGDRTELITAAAQKLFVTFNQTFCLRLQLIRMRIREGRQRGELGHLLDGFPRTQLQAQAMDEFVDTRLVINLQLREEVSLCWHSHWLRGMWLVFNLQLRGVLF